jgi:hypothetical protein
MLPYGKKLPYQWINGYKMDFCLESGGTVITTFDNQVIFLDNAMFSINIGNRTILRQRNTT